MTTQAAQKAKLKDYTCISSLEAIPQALKACDAWVLWKPKHILETDKVSKIPVNPRTYRNASSTNPATWASYDVADSALKPGFGLGFVVTDQDGILAIDLDNCIKNGKILPWARCITELINSYTEISPSGTGLRIFVKAEWPTAGNRKGALEVYSSGRFVTVTGNHLEGTPTTIESCQEAIDDLYRLYFENQAPTPVDAQKNETPAIPDTELIKIIDKSKQGAEFRQLLAGNWEGFFESQSQADQALCNILAFWTGKNAHQMDSIFRNSRLLRPKWDEKRGAKTYGERTIAKAIADTRNVFEPRSAKDDFADRCYFNDKAFVPRLLADDIMSENLIKFVAGELRVYEGGVYRAKSEKWLEKLAQYKLGNETRTNRIRETIEYIKRETHVNPPKPQCELINVKNGRINWRSGELIPHDPDMFEIVQLPLIYDPDAACPMFDQYLITTFEPDVVPLVQEIMGYCLLPDTRFEKAVMCIGAGRNGKSIFLFVLEQLLGSENISNIALQDLEENRFRAAELLGKLANIFADLDARALKGSSFFKMLVSGDTLTAERKFRDPFAFANYARLIFSANKLPRSADNSFAFYERWLIIPFERTFDTVNTTTDPNLRSKLSEPDELSGILNRALAGLRRLYSNGKFSEPGLVKAALDEYKRQNDSVMAFCEECVDPALDAVLSKSDFYTSYCRWCKDQGLHPVSQKKLRPSLVQIYPQVGEGRDGRTGPRVWLGIELNEDAPKQYYSASLEFDD